MSKQVKEMLVEEYRKRLNGVDDAVLVDIREVDANTNNEMRRSLKSKDIRITVVRNSLAKTAFHDTGLALFDPLLTGPNAIVYGGESVINVAREIVDWSKKIKQIQLKGAILDELRALDWVPRSVRSRAREIQRTMAELEHRFQRTPSEEEVADAMDVKVDVLRDHLGEIANLGFVALDELLNPSERDSGAMSEVIADPEAIDPSGSFEKEETRYMLADSINRLPDRERLVLTLYYYEGLTLAEIGGVLNVTESRICQIHTKAVMSLRNRFIEPAYR